MNKEQQMVKEFHEKFKCTINDKPKIPEEKILFLRSRLINEEASEFLVAAQKGDLLDMVDALWDKDKPKFCKYCKSDDISYIGPGMSYTGWQCNSCRKVW
jgi:hypothetical protein